MLKVVGWIKSHRLTSVLIVVIFYLLIKQSAPIYQMRALNYGAADYGAKSISSIQGGTMMPESVAPLANSYLKTNAPATERMVVADSYLSLVVKKVEDTHRQILKKVEELGGFMINSSINNPQENTNASLTIRIPSDQLETALKYFKSLSVKVVTENLTGEDVTNQYTDINARLKTLDQTKAIFEDMLLKATLIPDILNVQREIMSLQDQIDSLKGQAKYLEESSSLAKITVYLSTDELSLPYAPLDSWRPEQIMKEAVRSMISILRLVVGFLIWIGVYAAVWIPALLIFFFVKKRFFKKATD